jgi:DNA-binding response OmpR family regulator
MCFYIEMTHASPQISFEHANDMRIIQIDATRSYDVARRTLILPDSVKIGLTHRQGDVYRCLLNKPGHVLSNRQIIDGAYGQGYHIEENTVKVHINDMRQIVKGHTDWNPILNIKGFGYMANMDFEPPQPSERIDINKDGAYVDLRNFHVMRPDGVVVALTPAEFKVYKILLDHPGHLMSNSEILDLYEQDKAEQENYEPIEDKIIQGFICNLRKKFDCKKWDPILSRRGSGGCMANMYFEAPQNDDRVDLRYGAYFDKRNGRIYREGYPFEQLKGAQRNIFSDMASQPGITFTKSKILTSIAKDFNQVAKDATADVHICHLRAALKRLDLPINIIETVCGQGYRFNSKACALN